MKILSNFKYFFKQFFYLKVFFSPFITPRFKFYFGKIKMGTPYFLPRRWVKNPDKPGYLKAIPRKFGFDFISLGWKTKWTETDYRFEWTPGISFVAFNRQFFVWFSVPHPDHYWTSWLYYERDTDKSLSKEMRIAQCKKNFPQKWLVSHLGETRTIDYYEFILK